MNLKLRNRLITLATVLFVLSVAVNLSLSYRYAHVPLRFVTIPHPYAKMGQAVDGLVFSPDGKTLAVADTQTGISVWDVPKLHCRRRVEQLVGDGVSAPSWLLDTSTLTLGDSNDIRRWNMSHDAISILPAKQARFRRTIPKSEYWNVFQFHVVSRSGRLAAGADPIGDVVAWDVETGRQLFAQDALPKGKYGYPVSFCDIAFSPDDRFMAFSLLTEANFPLVNATLEIVIRDVQTGKIVRQWPCKEEELLNIGEESGGNLGATGLAFSPDGSILAVADVSRATIWNAKTGKLIQALAEVGDRFGGRKKLVFFHNGHFLAGCGWGDRIPTWNIDTGNLIQKFDTNSFTATVAVSPDNKLLATGGEYGMDGRIELWDISRFRQ